LANEIPKVFVETRGPLAILFHQDDAMPGSLEVLYEVVADISATNNDDIHVRILLGFLH
jgi:hypothetical protein